MGPTINSNRCIRFFILWKTIVLIHMLTHLWCFESIGKTIIIPCNLMFIGLHLNGFNFYFVITMGYIFDDCWKDIKRLTRYTLYWFHNWYLLLPIVNISHICTYDTFTNWHVYNTCHIEYMLHIGHHLEFMEAFFRDKFN